MTSFLNSHQKDSRELKTHSAHEDKKRKRKQQQKRVNKWGKWKHKNIWLGANGSLYTCRGSNHRRGQPRNYRKCGGKQTDRSLCWEQLDPTGPLLHLERRKEVYSLKKLNQRASGVTIPRHKRQQRQGWKQVRCLICTVNDEPLLALPSSHPPPPEHI